VRQKPGRDDERNGPRRSSRIPVGITVDSEVCSRRRARWRISSRRRGVSPSLAAQILDVDVDGAFVGVEGLALELSDKFESAPDDGGRVGRPSAASRIELHAGELDRLAVGV